MNFKESVFKSLLWRAVYFFSSLVLNIGIARYFEASVSGWIYYMINFWSLFVLVLSLSFEGGMGYYAARKEIPAGKLVALSLLWSVTGGLVSFIFFTLVPTNANKFIYEKYFSIISAAYITGYLLVTFFVVLFNARKNFVTPFLVHTVFNLLMFLIIPWSISPVHHVLGNMTYIALYFTGFFLQGLLFMFLFTSRYTERSEMSLPASKDVSLIARYSLQAFVANLFGFLLMRLDYWFVEYYSDAPSLGNYIQVSKMAQLFFIIPTTLSAVVFPFTAAKEDEENKEKRITSLCRMIFLASTAGCLLLALTGKWLFPFLFGNTFGKMYIPFILLTPGIIALSMHYSLTAYFAGKNKVVVNIAGSLISLTIIAIGDFLVIPVYGIAGASAVSSVGYSAYFLFLVYFFGKTHRSSLWDFIFIRKSDIENLQGLVMGFIKR
jgi:O-antigen/teichoic acid export membrane protein